ncbi:unnamed protein product, partial [Coregonus sp. 'balchen']
MDFDYQRLKDVESLRREERISCLPIQTQKPVPPHHSAEDPPTRQTLPIKPRRSLKVPKTPREEVALPAKQTNGQENERVSPALTLGRPGPLEPLSPSLRAHTLLWFERTQLPRLRRPGRPMPHWLHGFATRREAEELLKDKQQGCFLLRLSESKIGFVLSYRGMDRCRHFIIEEEEGGRGSCYLIAGEESRHKSLQELVSYYTQYPVGPFNEILTIPFDESSEACEGTVKLGLQDEGGEKTEASSSAPSAPATVQVQEILASSAPTNDRTPEYAVVKKVLKKSRSLPENQLGELLEVTNLILPQDVAKPGVSCAGAFGGGDDASDALYARVNKPPSMLSQTDTSPYVNVCNPPGQKGVTASSVPLMCRGSVGDPVYWKLDPLHTYEETPHLVQREEEEEAKEHIDFHAMGRWRDAERSAGGRDPQHHLYSEVNLRTREAPSHTPLPARTAPNRPLRLPPRPRCGDPILLSSSPSRPGVFLTPCSERPLTENPGTSIYEQIPKRPTSSRPPLPPPNPKP